MLSCKICGILKENPAKLSKHIQINHKDIKTKDYYDIYLLKKDDDLCLICKSPTKYQNINLGYKKYCGHSCAAIHKRKLLKENDQKNEIFKEKVRNNMIKKWKEREITGEKTKIIDKAKKTNKKIIQKLTKEERKKRFGWLNKYSGKERKEKIKKIIKPLTNFWKNGSDEEIKKVINKRTNTMIDRYGSNYYDDLFVCSEKTTKNLNKIFNIEE